MWEINKDNKVPKNNQASLEICKIFLKKLIQMKLYRQKKIVIKFMANNEIFGNFFPADFFFDFTNKFMNIINFFLFENVYFKYISFIIQHFYIYLKYYIFICLYIYIYIYIFFQNLNLISQIENKYIKSIHTLMYNFKENK